MNNPCDDCNMECYPSYKAAQKFDGCGPYGKLLGYQEGLAECEVRIHNREQEIVDYLQHIGTEACSADAMIRRLSDWLKGEA